MHIPDSAISPATSLVAGAAMAPVWYGASRRARASLDSKQAPLLGVGAAFCFTVMMFNIPAPGGTSVHPVGGVLLAVLLGPWAAIIGVTVALLIQALFFADGGVFALGANSFTMAFAMPVCGYAVYRLLSGRAASDSPWRALAAGIAAYVGVNLAALLASIILGIQPAFFHGADGRALYFPFGLRITIPAIMTAHLLIAGPAEAVVTTLAVRYLQTSTIPFYASTAVEGGKAYLGRAWLGLAALAALTPLGLLATGSAWGEWGGDEIAKRAGYAPASLEQVDAHGWKGFSLFPEYMSNRGWLFYVAAAVCGILLIMAAMLAVGRFLSRRETPAVNLARESKPRGRLTESLPDWLTSDHVRASTESSTGSAAHVARFVDKSLNELAQVTQEGIRSERSAERNGLLQRIDPRSKAVGLIGLVAAAVCASRPLVLACLYALALSLALLSMIPLLPLVRRVTLAVGFFAGAAILPSALNLVNPGAPLLVLTRNPYLAITMPGAQVALMLILRAMTSVTFIVLLAASTRRQDLLAAIRSVPAPRVFSSVVMMAYRYLGLLARTAAESFMARKSRTVGRIPRREHRQFLAGAISSLFHKSVALTSEVHSAMVSRGWSGEPRTLAQPRVRAADVVWLCSVLAICALAVYGGRHG